MLQTIPLFQDYYLEATHAEEFNAFYQAHAEVVYQNGSEFQISGPLSETERENVKRLGKNLDGVFRLFFFLKKGDERIGWFKGEQKDKESFSMSNTGIFEEYRNQGIYKAMLPKIVELVREAGFQRVISYHHPTNNAVLVPKLKAGFVIAGVEFTDEYGLLVKLTYFFNQTRKQALDYRVGLTRMSEELKPYFN